MTPVALLSAASRRRLAPAFSAAAAAALPFSLSLLGVASLRAGRTLSSSRGTEFPADAASAAVAAIATSADHGAAAGPPPACSSSSSANFPTSRSNAAASPAAAWSCAEFIGLATLHPAAAAAAAAGALRRPLHLPSAATAFPEKFPSSALLVAAAPYISSYRRAASCARNIAGAAAVKRKKYCAASSHGVKPLHAAANIPIVRSTTSTTATSAPYLSCKSLPSSPVASSFAEVSVAYPSSPTAAFSSSPYYCPSTSLAAAAAVTTAAIAPLFSSPGLKTDFSPATWAAVCASFFSDVLRPSSSFPRAAITVAGAASLYGGPLHSLSPPRANCFHRISPFAPATGATFSGNFACIPSSLFDGVSSFSSCSHLLGYAAPVAFFHSRSLLPAAAAAAYLCCQQQRNYRHWARHRAFEKVRRLPNRALRPGCCAGSLFPFHVSNRSTTYSRSSSRTANDSTDSESFSDSNSSSSSCDRGCAPTSTPWSGTSTSTTGKSHSSFFGLPSANLTGSMAVHGDYHVARGAGGKYQLVPPYPPRVNKTIEPYPPSASKYFAVHRNYPLQWRNIEYKYVPQRLPKPYGAAAAPAGEDVITGQAGAAWGGEIIRIFHRRKRRKGKQ